MHPAKEKWDLRYQDEAQWQHKEPKRLLCDYIHILPETGIALDLACGTGVNGLVLAKRGWDVISLDISIIGLKIAQKAFHNNGQRFVGILMDSGDFSPRHSVFDCILNFSFLDRSIIPVLKNSLLPGGILFFETPRKFREFQSDHYLIENELQSLFSDFEILFSGERQFLDNGILYKISDQLIARKRNE